ncbi:type-F conjugative transfer system protein TraW [Piscirickettsia salmonis]|uniref:type-F conjugative transfer system protein TraW n=1 Tax=Piscirickettsia salmonis TaxID=1238 RepID=UPI0006BCA4B1|nr:type-F conjugative transfer system protein TraW [Piscirickettsia salmonis]ALA26641.1 conjugal transfer protein TraW [Piscirickettsia salmonis]APS45854.1 hypothetical protein AVI48_15590 [Piscirickettsia salmonis]APS49263.1 hypothetical protein AVI49_16535 [Piscirickettsia salmonis]QGO82350.1 conjugal transfer pilus assembly protein TraW [Piscirickettsia salmonis]QGP24179.1 conjugal transfer pilus assembly protein TraW [Piscirickettsia salmonis]
MSKLLMALMMIFFAVSGFAKNIGTEGQVYPIKELDFRQFIQQRLAQMKEKGEIKRYEAEAQHRVAKEVYHPPTLPLTQKSDSEVYTVDPSIKLTRPITDNMGRILVKAGTVVNPFHTVHLKSVLIFFNGDDAEQVNWVKHHYQQYKWVKFILTGGDIRDAANLFGRIYYDQYGNITRKLHIKHVPAIAQQDGLKWKITVIGSKEL